MCGASQPGWCRAQQAGASPKLGMKADAGHILCHIPSALFILLWVFLVSLTSVLVPTPAPGGSGCSGAWWALDVSRDQSLNVP